jgi:ligand-binding sensor domain-containing protein/signal transduction histidine kinase
VTDRFPPVAGLRLTWLVVCSLILAISSPGLLASSTRALAQYSVEVRTVDDGLPQNSVNAVLQSHDGYLWLATNGGLARYDGVSFRTFDVSNTPAITSNRILSLCEDREGSLWIGTENQGLMRFKDGVFTSYPAVKEIKNQAVAAIIEAREGGLWMATATALVRLKDGVFTSYPGNHGLPARVAPWSRSMVEDQQGDLWVALDGGLFRLSKERSVLYTMREGLPDNHVHAVCEDWEGSLWIGTERGLVKMRDGSFTTYSLKDGLTDDYITCLAMDRAGRLWVGTQAGGVMQRAEDRWTAIRSADGLSDENIRCISEDREGNLWVGTTTGGLNRLREKKLKQFTEAEGFPATSIVPITQDRAGDMWMGATCGGLIRFHAGRFVFYKTKDGLPNNCVWALSADQDGSLWIGTWGEGLTHFKDGRFMTYNPDNSGLSGRVVKAIWQDGDGALWIGTDAGLNRLQDGKFKVWRTSDGLINERINFITGDSQGAIWVCTNAGLSRFKDGAFTNYTKDNGLSNSGVRVIYEDAEGTLWMGTYGGGLNRFRYGRFTHYSTHDGLFEDTVSQILEDRNGNLWMSGNKGIARVSRKELNDFAEGRVKAITSVSYGVADGMPNRECNGGGQPAGWKTREGHMWFPTVKGPVIVDPGKITTNHLPPLVAIEQASINTTLVDLKGNVEISPGKGDLEFHYTGLSFSAPEKVRFRYQLQGYDDTWVNAGARRVAYYTNVPPGRYSFRVMACNDEGVWTESGAALTFYLRPRFYQTWWFYLLAAVSLAGVIVLVYKRRMRKLRQAHAAQQAFSRQLIEGQEAERKRIAAELHDSIGQSLAIIRNLALVGLSNPEDHTQSLEQLNEVSTAASEALVEVKAVAHNLRPYQLDRLGLTKALDAMVKTVSGSSDIRFVTDIAELDSVVPKGAEINLYRIVQESLNNIVKHSAATEAGVIVRKTGQNIHIEIRDNGKGFAPGSFSDSRPGGLGLVSIAERAKILGAKWEIQAAPGRGTIISIDAGLGGLPK